MDEFFDLMHLEPNKVSVNLSQYSMVWTGDTGVGKTHSMMKFLRSIDSREPLFLEFEDRFQNIPGITAIRIKTRAQLMNIIGQLNNPALHDRYSCIIIDTLDKFEEFCEKYVTDAKGVEIIKDAGAYGEGTSRFKASLRLIGDMQRKGYTVHAIAQASHSKDFKTNEESDSMKLNKNTFSYFRESAYLIGYLSKDDTDNRFLTFKKTRSNPDLKDTFNLPEVIALDDLKDTWIDAIEKLGEDNITKEKTVDSTITHAKDFKTLKAEAMHLGNALYTNGFETDANNVLAKNLGVNSTTGATNGFEVLTESQIEVMEVIVFELTELIKKYKIKVQ